MHETMHAPTPTHRLFDDFYRNHRDSVARALGATLGDEDLGTEACDEAMARAYERWSTVSTMDNQPGWVYRVGLNWARDHLRKQARRARLRREEVIEPEPTDPALIRALQSLPIDARSVLVLRFFLDWSIEEIALALDRPTGTVKSRLNRALTRLSKTLEDLR
jgi:RNA polymerase sigma-70 factor, ECF subfamily